MDGAAIPALNGELLEWMKSIEAFKMKVRIHKDGSADIETDTDEEAKQAAAFVEARRKERANEAIKVLPLSRSGTTLEQAKQDYIDERTTTLAKGTMPKVRGVL